MIVREREVSRMISRFFLSNWRMEMGKTEKKSRFGAVRKESKHDTSKVRFEMYVRYEGEVT